jgi:hypothetical protein
MIYLLNCQSELWLTQAEYSANINLNFITNLIESSGRRASRLVFFDHAG